MRKAEPSGQYQKIPRVRDARNPHASALRVALLLCLTQKVSSFTAELSVLISDYVATPWVVGDFCLVLRGCRRTTIWSHFKLEWAHGHVCNIRPSNGRVLVAGSGFYEGVEATSARIISAGDDICDRLVAALREHASQRKSLSELELEEVAASTRNTASSFEKP